MRYIDPGYNRLMIGDSYPWELDSDSDSLVIESYPDQETARLLDAGLETIRPEDITEDFNDT
ncbi:MAG TPA: hypothetical protein VJ461_06500 [Candidatus Nanoarchaeia archaeon]|nr:hypothetical protein [Candidatus Nanoarchaeia archaeon]